MPLRIPSGYVFQNDTIPYSLLRGGLKSVYNAEYTIQDLWAVNPITIASAGGTTEYSPYSYIVALPYDYTVTSKYGFNIWQTARSGTWTNLNLQCELGNLFDNGTAYQVSFGNQLIVTATGGAGGGIANWAFNGTVNYSGAIATNVPSIVRFRWQFVNTLVGSITFSRATIRVWGE